MSHKDESEQVRLNKYIAQCGICSRRDADKIIEEGRVSVNGQPALAGTKVNPGDVVKIDGKRIKLVTDTKVYAYYKPEGVVCTQRDAHAQRTVATEIKTPVKVNYAGRLDANSSGLLILSNDGELINRMMKSSNNHEKEYVVRALFCVRWPVEYTLKILMLLQKDARSLRPEEIHSGSSLLRVLTDRSDVCVRLLAIM